MSESSSGFAKQNVGKALPELDADKCIGCGRCMEVCPTKVVTLVHNTGSNSADLNIACIKCGHCMATCPTEAISVRWFNYSDMPPVGEKTISREDLISYIKSRKSCRNFTDELISDDEIQAILNVVQYSASAHNQHKSRWGVIKGKEAIRRLADEVIDIIDGDPFYEAFVKAYRSGKNSLTREASHLFFVYMPTNALVPVEDGTVAMAALESVLPAFGLGGCWGGYMTRLGRENEKVKELLRIPEKCKLIGTMLVGYPAESEHYLRIIPRGEADVTFIEEL